MDPGSVLAVAGVAVRLQSRPRRLLELVENGPDLVVRPGHGCLVPRDHRHVRRARTVRLPLEAVV
ncbi:MAG: hypothetical protein OXE58_16840 [Acidobacteria bacterium]|nr:hypothetical protein [Acidobacteriota bacterium]